MQLLKTVLMLARSAIQLLFLSLSQWRSLDFGASTKVKGNLQISEGNL
jgi:hypothetical protein